MPAQKRTGRVVSVKPVAHHFVRSPWPALAAALLASACGSAESSAHREPSNLQAVLSIERLEEVRSHTEEPFEAGAFDEEELAGEQDVARGSALAQFLVLPAAVDPMHTLDWAGLRVNLPEPTRCFDPSREGELLEGPSDAEPLELLAAGDVTVRAAGEQTRLALNFFPPSGAAGGVLYTSRDQSAAPLPVNEVYHIDVSGSDAVPPLSIEGSAPDQLRSVAIAGKPIFAEGDLQDEDGAAAGEGPVDPIAVQSGSELELTWAEGSASDRVFIHLSSDERTVLCAFHDSDGAGTVPGSLTASFVPGSELRIGVHRVREVATAEELSPSAAELVDAVMVETTMRFDFEVAATLRVD